MAVALTHTASDVDWMLRVKQLKLGEKGAVELNWKRPIFIPVSASNALLARVAKSRLGVLLCLGGGVKDTHPQEILKSEEQPPFLMPVIKHSPPLISLDWIG